MKKVFLMVLLFLPVLGRAEKPAPNPADYTVAVHVQASHIALDSSDVTGGSSVCVWNQHLNATLDGKKFDLVGNRATKSVFVLRVGDYKAKVLKEDTSRSYEYQRSYEFLFADGTTGDFQVTGELE